MAQKIGTQEGYSAALAGERRPGRPHPAIETAFGPHMRATVLHTPDGAFLKVEFWRRGKLVTVFVEVDEAEDLAAA